MDNLAQMEVSYHREMKSNYLMITVDEEREQGFETKMLIGNSIDGLLKFRIRKSDAKCQFCYEITSKQPLGRLLERKTLHAEQLRRLLLEIAQTLTRMEDYLLTEEQILLNPEFIYVDLESFQPSLCLFPGKKGNFPQEFSELLQFLLDKVDYQDKEAVVLIYGLYRESLKDNYGLDNLLRWLIKEDYPMNCKAEEEQAIRPKFEQKDDQRELQREDPREERKEKAKIEKHRNLDVVTTEPTRIRLPRYGIVCAGFLAVGVCLAGILLRLGHLTGAAFLVVLIALLLLVVYWGFNRWKTFLGGRICVDIADESGAEQNSSKPESWEMVFAEEEPTAENEAVEDEDEDTHTVLLWSSGMSEASRRLIAEESTQMSITIAYYPFLIGKQDGLVDHVIAEETVSRLHVRIDHKGEEYWLTDLNSTNGTIVNGKRLNANETVPLTVGDLVEIANLRYRFQ